MTGPSAIGSEKGTPSSITSAPPSCIASMIGTVASLVGNPAVTNVTKAALPYVDGKKDSSQTTRCSETVCKAARSLLTSAFRFSNTALIPSAIAEVGERCVESSGIQGSENSVRKRAEATCVPPDLKPDRKAVITGRGYLQCTEIHHKGLEITECMPIPDHQHGRAVAAYDRHR